MTALTPEQATAVAGDFDEQMTKLNATIADLRIASDMCTPDDPDLDVPAERVVELLDEIDRLRARRTADDLWTWLLQCLTCGHEHPFRPAGSEQCDTCKQGLSSGTWASAEDGHGNRERWRNSGGLRELRAAWDQLSHPLGTTS